MPSFKHIFFGALGVALFLEMSAESLAGQKRNREDEPPSYTEEMFMEESARLAKKFPPDKTNPRALGGQDPPSYDALFPSSSPTQRPQENQERSLQTPALGRTASLNDFDRVLKKIGKGTKAVGDGLLYLFVSFFS